MSLERSGGEGGEEEEEETYSIDRGEGLFKFCGKWASSARAEQKPHADKEVDVRPPQVRRKPQSQDNSGDGLNITPKKNNRLVAVFYEIFNRRLRDKLNEGGGRGVPYILASPPFIPPVP